MERRELRRIAPHRTQQLLEHGKVRTTRSLTGGAEVLAVERVEEVHLARVLIEQREQVAQEPLGIADERPEEHTVAVLRHAMQRDRDDELGQRAVVPRRPRTPGTH